MKPARPVVRIWNDGYAYKKMYVLFGFDALRRTGQIALIKERYEAFEGREAPSREGAPYNSHKNIVIFEVEIGGKTTRCVYDANDIYYKIPPRLLDWCDLYFKSNYQESYLHSGQRVAGDYWDALPILDALIPEPVDVSQAFKFRRANFSMELHASMLRNRWYFYQMQGRWLKSAVASKPHDVFFLGRYWAETRAASLALMDHVCKSGRRVAGGIVEAKDPVPESYRSRIHKAVGLADWCRMASSAKVPVITRGLQGCIGFKPLNLLMIGAPIFANRLMSNLRTPLVEDVNYVVVADDFSDLNEKLETTSDACLRAMGEANFKHWNDVASPLANARYLMDEARARIECQ
ncbi:MAG: hypothetical protein ACOVMP_00165 [Chthoniobacterales bacterium]